MHLSWPVLLSYKSSYAPMILVIISSRNSLQYGSCSSHWTRTGDWPLRSSSEYRFLLACRSSRVPLVEAKVDRSLIYKCNFEGDFCNFIQNKNDSFDWRRFTGRTPSSLTGPQADHTSGRGEYAQQLLRKVIATGILVFGESQLRFLISTHLKTSLTRGQCFTREFDFRVTWE